MISIYCEPMPEDGFGVVYLQLPQCCFPAENWDDFGGYMAFDWLGETVHWLERQEVGDCVYSFYEGPFEFHIADAGAESLSLTCYKRTLDGLTPMSRIAPLTVSRREFLVSVLRLVEKITWRQNVDKVSHMVDELRRYI